MDLAGRATALRGCSPLLDPNSAPPAGFPARTPSFVQTAHTAFTSPQSGSLLWWTNRAAVPQQGYGSLASTLPPVNALGSSQASFAASSATFPSPLHLVRAYVPHLSSPYADGTSSSSACPLVSSREARQTSRLLASSVECPPYSQGGTFVSLSAAPPGSETSFFLPTDVSPAPTNYSSSSTSQLAGQYDASQVPPCVLSAGHRDRRLHSLLSASPSLPSQSTSTKGWRFSVSPQQGEFLGTPGNAGCSSVSSDRGSEAGTRTAACRTARLKASVSLHSDAGIPRQRQQHDGFKLPQQISASCSSAEVVGGRGGTRRRGRKPGRPLPKGLAMSSESTTSSSGSRYTEPRTVSTLESRSPPVVARREIHVVENNDSGAPNPPEHVLNEATKSSERTQAKKGKDRVLPKVRWHRLLSVSSSKSMTGAAAEAAATELNTTLARNVLALQTCSERGVDCSSSEEGKRGKRCREEIVLPVWAVEGVVQEVKRQLRQAEEKRRRSTLVRRQDSSNSNRHQYSDPDGPGHLYVHTHGEEKGARDSSSSVARSRDYAGDVVHQGTSSSSTAEGTRTDPTVEETRVGSRSTSISGSDSKNHTGLHWGEDGEGADRGEVVKGRGQRPSALQGAADPGGSVGQISPTDSAPRVQVDWERVARAFRGLASAGLCESAFRACTTRAGFLWSLGSFIVGRVSLASTSPRMAGAATVQQQELEGLGAMLRTHVQALLSLDEGNSASQSGVVAPPSGAPVTAQAPSSASSVEAAKSVASGPGASPVSLVSAHESVDIFAPETSPVTATVWPTMGGARCSSGVSAEIPEGIMRGRQKGPVEDEGQHVRTGGVVREIQKQQQPRAMATQDSTELVNGSQYREAASWQCAQLEIHQHLQQHSLHSGQQTGTACALAEAQPPAEPLNTVNSIRAQEFSNLQNNSRLNKLL
ncbi:hypothetical protein CSUI_007722 [Cystoisospora suis]|uniref:Uncharacterized protein n=1 Tax=Cystoisospora suis TaxID=483139 RepID=A0A2C6KQ08_9APIC|nr:hypothetical protein CSUI_007722 [Cystoisospora suis]